MREPEGISQTLRFPDNEKPRLRRKCRGNRGGKPGGLLDRELRDRRVAEPLVIDLRVGAVLIDLAETIVDLGEQFRVALADSDTEVLFLEIRVARHVEVLAGVLLRIVREDTDVTDRGVDAAIGDVGVFAYYAQQNPGKHFNMTRDPNFEEQYFGIAVRKGNTKLLAQINDGLRKVYKNGTYAKVYHKWFGNTPVPKLPIK